MKLIENQDYVYYDSGLMLNSKQPMKNVDVCLVSTKDYVFYIPKKTVGTESDPSFILSSFQVFLLITSSL